MAQQPLRKLSLPEPPRPRTAIPPPANDNRRGRSLLLAAGMFAALGALAYALLRLIG